MAVTLIDTATLAGAALPSGPPLVLRGPETIALADTYAELFAVVFADEEESQPRGGVHGYADRYAAALRLAREVNTDALAVAQADGVELSAEELAGLQRDRPEQEAFEGEWSHSYPLVLLRTDYAPFTEKEVATGPFVVMVDPFTYSTLLDSLARADVLALEVRGDAPDGPGTEPDEFVVDAIDEIVADTDATLQTFVSELLREVEETGKGPAWLAATLTAAAADGATEAAGADGATDADSADGATDADIADGATEADIADGFLVWFVDSTGESTAGADPDGLEDSRVAAARFARLLLEARGSDVQPEWEPGPATPRDVVAGATFLVDFMAASLGS